MVAFEFIPAESVGRPRVGPYQADEIQRFVYRRIVPSLDCLCCTAEVVVDIRRMPQVRRYT